MMKSGVRLDDLEGGYSTMLMQTIDISIDGKLHLLAHWYDWEKGF